MDKMFDDIERYFENDLNEEEINILMKSLSDNPKDRDFFEKFNYVKSEITKNDLTIDAPVALKQNLLAELDFKHEDNKYQYFWSTFLTLLIFTSVASLVMYFFSVSKIPISDSFFVESNKIRSELHVDNNIRKNKPVIEESRDISDELFVENKNKRNEFLHSLPTENSHSDLKSGDIYLAKQEERIEPKHLFAAQQHLISGTDIYENNSTISFVNTDINSGNLSAINGTTGINSSLLIGINISLKGNYNYFLQKSVSEPSDDPAVQNVSLDINYQMFESLEIGVGFTQEKFNLAYKVVEEEAREYMYYQQPNYLTTQIHGKYIHNHLLNFRQFAQVSFGLNRTGVVFRGGAGLIFMPFEQFGVEFATTYSIMFYDKSNIIYNTDKIGFNLGVIWKL